MSATKFMKQLRKKTGSTSFTDSKYGRIDHYIDTGSLGLNRIISGSIYKGIPSGKVVIVAGDSQTLKTILAINIAANALNENDYDVIFYIDAELGGGYDTFVSFDCDTDKVEHVVVDNVEDCTIKILQIYKMIEEEQKENPDFKALFVLDSLGALVTNKLHVDATEKNKLVSEMGGRAKLINSMVKGLTVPAGKTNCGFLIINHTYDDPAAMYASKVKNMSGGKGIQYQSSLVIQCAKKLEKSADNEENFYAGSLIRFFTVKNRLIQPYIETEEFISFSDGIGSMKFLSLFDLAIDLGFIKQESTQFFSIPSWEKPEAKFRKKVLIGGEQAEAIWATFIKEFDEKAGESIRYSKVTKEKLEEFGIEDPDVIDEILEENTEEEADA